MIAARLQFGRELRDLGFQIFRYFFLDSSAQILFEDLKDGNPNHRGMLAASSFVERINL